MEFDGQSEIPESGIKEAVMSTADHSSDHRTVIYLQRDRGIFEMTAESAGAGHTEQKTRIVKVIKSQGSPHTDIQIPIASLGCPIPPAAAPIIDSRNGQPFKMRSRQRELQKIPRRKIALIKKFHAISQP